LPVHVAPVALHEVDAQIPPVHCPRQQSVFAAQPMPAPAQNELAVQTEALQMAPAQQSVDVPHAAPSALHMPVPPPLPPLPPAPPSPVGVPPQ
jgi:hypothetical protein